MNELATGQSEVIDPYGCFGGLPVIIYVRRVARGESFAVELRGWWEENTGG